jgi:hypothetical protein
MLLHATGPKGPVYEGPFRRAKARRFHPGEEHIQPVTDLVTGEKSGWRGCTRKQIPRFARETMPRGKRDRPILKPAIERLLTSIEKTKKRP